MSNPIPRAMLTKESKNTVRTFQGLRSRKIMRITPITMAVADTITVAAIVYSKNAKTADIKTSIATIHAA